LIDLERLKAQLVRHEGMVLTTYECTAGKTTLGVGRNVQEVGITEAEAMHLLSNDIARVAGECYGAFSWFKDLDELRKEAVINMVFNLGLTRFKQFKKTISYIEAGEFQLAGAEALDSKWAKDVGNRAVEVANQLAGNP